MKKLLSFLLSTTLAVSCASVAFAADEVKAYVQPFEAWTMGSRSFRIPSIITLNDGSVLASVDLRYDHGSDSPNNLDTVVAKSADGYTGWKRQIVNYFDDYELGASAANSASFIDPALVQSKETGRIFLIVDAFPSGGGARACEKGTGYVDFNGKKCLALTNTDDYTKKISKFEYVITDFENGFAKIVDRSNGNPTGYSVDREYDLYKDGQPVYMTQNGTGKQIQQNVFYIESDFTVYKTMYQWIRFSDDNGETWSAPELITAQVKSEKETFLGIGPGKGFVTNIDGHERIIFLVYDNSTLGIERASTIYSDDNGATWRRGERLTHKIGLGKTSESQIIDLPDGTLRMYSRNSSNYVAYADSNDGGVTWTTSVSDINLECTKNCMVSFINYNAKKIDGKDVVIGSYASNASGRADGVIRVGTIDSDNEVTWLTTYHINQSFFAYSCLTELADGNIAILCEDELDRITYKVLSVGDDGELKDVAGNDFEFNSSMSGWQKFVKALNNIFVRIGVCLGIL